MSKLKLFKSVFCALMQKSQVSKLSSKRYFGDKSQDVPLKLMNFPQVIWPSVIKTIKNYFFAVIIRSQYDNTFTLQNFLDGSEQAVVKVSSLISQGDFESLEGLVTTEAIKEIEVNYKQLSEDQKGILKVDSDDLFLKSVHEVGMIMPDNSDKRYVEITTVMQGFRGLKKVREASINEISNSMIARPEDIYVCNYRFFKELKKEEEDDGWIINKLNHFNPK